VVLLAPNARLWISELLTVVDAVGDTSAALSVDSAHILLQAGVCDTARAFGNGTVVVGALGPGSCEGGESEDDGGDGELHFCGRVGWLVIWEVSVIVFMLRDY